MLSAEQSMANVVLDRCRKEHGLLLYERDVLSKPSKIQCRDIMAIEKYLSSDGIVEAFDEANNRRLSGP